MRDLASFATLTKIALDIAAAKEEENAAEARLAELSRRPPSIQAAPDVARLMDDLGLSRFLPLLLADEAADMGRKRTIDGRRPRPPSTGNAREAEERSARFGSS